MDGVDVVQAAQLSREAELSSLSPEIRDAQLASEQLMRDAKQQGNQGNLVMRDGKLQLLSEDDMGADLGKYRWGQTEKEVTIKVSVPAGTKSKAVKLDVLTSKLKLAVMGEVILDGVLHKPVKPDDCTFTIEDEGTGRLVTVTLQKLQATSASQHWKCVCDGEPEIDTSIFGPAIMTADPSDPAGLAQILAAR